MEELTAANQQREATERLNDCVLLLALGALHWKRCMGRDLEGVIEILGEEFARPGLSRESLEELRAYLAEHGILVPEMGVQTGASNSTQAQENPSLPKQEPVCTVTKKDEAVHRDTGIKTEDDESGGLARFEGCAAHREICEPKAVGPTGSGWWRGWPWNRVPPAIEEAIRERFAQGWSKSRLACEFRLNRRTVIRICAAVKSKV